MAEKTSPRANHFMDEKPTKEHPNPTLFLNPSAQVCSSSVKRRKVDHSFDDNIAESSDASGEPADIPEGQADRIALTFCHIRV